MPDPRLPVTFLGPQGTFTAAAVELLRPDVGEGAVPIGSVAAALAAVADRRAGSAVVPFENSVEGSVPATLDALIHGPELMIAAEAHLQVEFALLAHPDTRLADVRRVATHPHAAAQTRGWMTQHLPDAEVVSEASTARAAELVAQGGYDAAVAAPAAAALHGLVVLADGLADRRGAVTRFVELTLPGPPPPATGADTTTLVAFIRRNHPGALLEVLEQFAVRGVDLTRLESRPTGEGLGQYCFVVDAVGHLEEPRMADALAGLHRACGSVRYLGSYARADGAHQPIAPHADSLAYEQARDWLHRLLTGPER